MGEARKDARAFALGHAADDSDDEVGFFFFGFPQLAEARPDFLLGVLADGAGVVDDDVRVVAVLDGFVALGAKLAENELRVEDVHLAAECFEVELPGHPRAIVACGVWHYTAAFRNRLPSRRIRRSDLMNAGSCFGLLAVVWVMALAVGCAQKSSTGPNRKAAIREAQVPRERLLLDAGWRFALGHPSDRDRDFGFNKAGFSYLAKAGSADGAAAGDFDDRAWREVDLPHDWEVELSFDPKADTGHGGRPVHRGWPENNIGWYRKKFTLAEADRGKRIAIEFDGVFRDSLVFVNGFLMGRHGSGYTGFRYDITDVVNFGESNTVAVRVDATMTEGWFYEGAGIYRHVWLTKSAPLHVDYHGTSVTSDVKDGSAQITARATIVNDGEKDAAFEITQSIFDPAGNSVAEMTADKLALAAGEKREFPAKTTLTEPKLWSLQTPQLYRLVTTVRQGDATVDRYETPFGIRTVRFDANQGFFLKGTCNHQDHAGVGVALPDGVNEFRIAKLKEMGCNGYRTSHNPPTSELLDACDRMGMLVLDETRMMGTGPEQLGELEWLIQRDRNHPSVIAWSVGNEEWSMEGSERGAKVTAAMQAFADRLDPTRMKTVAISGGWGNGSSKTIQIMGFNYLAHGNIDQYHKAHPDQPSWGSEEGSVFSTRGVYVEDAAKAHLTGYDIHPVEHAKVTAEKLWNFYLERPFLAGMFVWTGFDYRGEPTPFPWPAVSSQYGIIDACGFAKDTFYYYQAWWTDSPVLHLFPHWNWQGKEGKEIDVWVHSNCDEVELFLNGESLGRKAMKRNSHLEWKVKYAPGTLLARGYKDGKEILTDRVETTGTPARIQLAPHRGDQLVADGRDVSIIAVSVHDQQGRFVANADDNVMFSLAGPGRIIGVGNGDPSCLEPDKFVDVVRPVPVAEWRVKPVDDGEKPAEVAPDFDDSQWQPAQEFRGRGRRPATTQAAWRVYRASVELPDVRGEAVSMFKSAFGIGDVVYVNGQAVSDLEHLEKFLKSGRNVFAVVTKPGPATRPSGGGPRRGPSATMLRISKPAGQWQRSVFGGLAQIIVQSTNEPGEITLTASGKELAPATLKLRSSR